MIKRTKKHSLFLSFLLLVILIGIYSDHSQKKKVQKTLSDLQNIKIILEYHGLKNLNQINITDAWGSTLDIQLQNKSITLTSFGSDKHRGGKGYARDIIIQINPVIHNSRRI